MASRIMEYTIHNYFIFFFFKLQICSIHNEPVCLSGDFVLVKRVNFTAAILKWQWLHLKTVKMLTVASKYFYLLQCFSLTYSQYLGKVFLWWVNPGWMPGIHQSCSVTSLLSWSEERKYNEKPAGPDKDRDRSITNYSPSRP